MIGVVGYGFVGKAVVNGFNCENIVCDPKHNDVTIDQVVQARPVAIFVCVPTPLDDGDTNSMSCVVDVVTKIKQHGYSGIIIVKSTVLPGILGDDVVCNPEFLSRDSADVDFQQPSLLVFGGDQSQSAHDVYKQYSLVKPRGPVIHTDNNTACMIKYTMNCFYATKLCYMNTIHEIAERCDADYDTIKLACEAQPWMGTHHFDVPGPDGKKGFGGPCLPKDLKTFANRFNIGLFKDIYNQNQTQRKVDI